MSEWLQRWQWVPRHWQWLTVLGFPMLLLMLSAWWWLLPLRNSLPMLIHQHQQLQQQYQQHLTSLQNQPPLVMQMQQNQQLSESMLTAKSSIPTLINLITEGVIVEKWQPAPQGEELSLLLDWFQFQHILASLASSQPPVKINSLLLQRERKKLRMILNIGQNNEK